MYRSSRMHMVLAAAIWGAQAGIASDAFAGEPRTIESVSPSGAGQTTANTRVEREKECIGAQGAQVCWLQFTDGTRCVVASNAEGGDSSTALNCHFSTSLERLHRMPKD